jgi:hypothetical protein
MNTKDLDSYYPGYDAYCDELEEKTKVPFDDYKKIEEERDNLKNLLDDIKSTLKEKTTMIEKYKILNALIEDFEV